MLNKRTAITRKSNRLWFLLATGFIVLAITASAYAHSAVLWCYVENDRVYVEAFFMGGNKIQNGKIVVVDNNGKKLLEGMTTKQGLFDFAPPVRDDMTIVLTLDAGHGSEFKLTKQDFLDAEKDSAPGK